MHLYLDTVDSVETPEGVGILYRLAGPAPRACAWMIDLMIRVGLLFVIGIIVSFSGFVVGEEAVMGLYLIVIFALEWFYPVLFDVYHHGQTPGKQLLKLRVVHQNGTPIGWSGSLLRNLLRTADFLPFAYFTGLLVCLFSSRFQRLGDMIAGTVVIYTQTQTVDTSNLPSANPKPPRFALTLEEQRAVIAFAERYNDLSGDRMIELANILSNHRTARDKDAVEELFQEAAWHLGVRA